MYTRPDPNTVTIQHAHFIKLNLSLSSVNFPPIEPSEPFYAACPQRWAGFSLVDYGLISNAAYFESKNELEGFLKAVFSTNAPPFEIRRSTHDRRKSLGSVTFFEFYCPENNASIISVRGTDIGRFSDFIEDIRMYSEPIVFLILSGIFPTIRIWPDITTSTLIELYHEFLNVLGLQTNEKYYESLIQYVKNIQDREVILTGHSLGGAIARIVGSILGKRSITFSPPGIVQSYRYVFLYKDSF